MIVVRRMKVPGVPGIDAELPRIGIASPLRSARTASTHSHNSDDAKALGRFYEAWYMRPCGAPHACAIRSLIT